MSTRPRPEWLEATVRAAQLAALLPLESQSNLREAVAAIFSAIEPPSGPLETVFALHLAERATWEVLRMRSKKGIDSLVDTADEFQRIITIAEHTTWEHIPTALRYATVVGEAGALADSVRAFLDGHYTETITLQHTARALGSSVRRLSAQFRRHYGVTVHEYITRRRVLYAARLLVGTDQKISAIALSVGFRDQTALFRQFARLLRTTPGAVRVAGPDVLDKFIAQLETRRQL